MKRMALMLSLTLAVGIALGVTGTQVLNAQYAQQQAPVKATELLRADVVGVDGKEAIISFVEILPRGASGKHHHPAHSFGYILEGALTFEEPGKPPHTVRAGEAFQETPGNVHDAKNLTGSPVKVVSFRVHPKGQPITVRQTESYFVK